MASNPKAAGLVVRARDTGRIFVTLRSADIRDYPGTYNLISGFVEAGDTPEETALKELKEETGVTDVALQNLRRLSISPARGNDPEFHTFIAEIEREQDLVPDLEKIAPEHRWENSTFKWLRYEEIPSESRLHPGFAAVLKAHTSEIFPGLSDDIPRLGNRNIIDTPAPGAIRVYHGSKSPDIIADFAYMRSALGPDMSGAGFYAVKDVSKAMGYLRANKVTTGGYLYTVDFDFSYDQALNLTPPVSRQAMDRIDLVLREEDTTLNWLGFDHASPPKGNDLWKKLRDAFGNQRASDVLLRAGFKGVYHDNLVVALDPKDIHIRQVEHIVPRSNAKTFVLERHFIDKAFEEIRFKAETLAKRYAYLKGTIPFWIERRATPEQWRGMASQMRPEVITTVQEKDVDFFQRQHAQGMSDKEIIGLAAESVLDESDNTHRPVKNFVGLAAYLATLPNERLRAVKNDITQLVLQVMAWEQNASLDFDTKAHALLHFTDHSVVREKVKHQSVLNNPNRPDYPRLDHATELNYVLMYEDPTRFLGSKSASSIESSSTLAQNCFDLPFASRVTYLEFFLKKLCDYRIGTQYQTEQEIDQDLSFNNSQAYQDTVQYMHDATKCFEQPDKYFSGMPIQEIVKWRQRLGTILDRAVEELTYNWELQQQWARAIETDVHEAKQKCDSAHERIQAQLHNLSAGEFARLYVQAFSKDNSSGDDHRVFLPKDVAEHIMESVRELHKDKDGVALKHEVMAALAEFPQLHYFSENAAPPHYQQKQRSESLRGDGAQRTYDMLRVYKLLGFDVPENSYDPQRRTLTINVPEGFSFADYKSDPTCNVPSQYRIKRLIGNGFVLDALFGFDAAEGGDRILIQNISNKDFRILRSGMQDSFYVQFPDHLLEKPCEIDLFRKAQDDGLHKLTPIYGHVVNDCNQGDYDSIAQQIIVIRDKMPKIKTMLPDRDYCIFEQRLGALENRYASSIQTFLQSFIR